MNSHQEISLKMQMTVRDCLLKNAAITATLPRFTQFFTPFTETVIQIQKISEQRSADKKGITVTKELIRENLIRKTKDIAGKTEAYAMNSNNEILAGEVHFTLSDLKHLTLTELHDVGQLICDRALTNAADLLEYGVTADAIAEFQKILDDFNRAIPKAKLSIAETKQLTSKLQNLFHINENHLDALDKLVEIVRYSHPEFYEVYKNSRKLSERAVQKTSLILNVKTAEAGESLANAMVKIIRVEAENTDKKLNGSKATICKTSEHGGIKVKHLPAGVYKAEISKNGYATQKVSINITGGETAHIEAMIEKLE